MSGSNEEWGELAERDTELADSWDSYSRLPEPGENPELDAFCTVKNISIPALMKIGARLSSETVLAFAHPGGIKYRDITTGKKWSHLGSTYGHIKIVPAESGSADVAIVSEGETDGAWLAEAYPQADIAIMPAGAKHFPKAYVEAVVHYDLVLVALDIDTSGEVGSKRILDNVPQAVRFPPPTEKDWCLLAQADAPELPNEAPEDVKILVPVQEMMKMEVPEVASWFDNNILPIGGLMMIHGWTKGFKSFISLDMMAALAQAEPWCLFEPMEEPCKTAVLQYELPWPFYRQRVAHLFENAKEPDLFEQNFFTWTPMIRPTLIAGNTKQEDFVLKNLVESGIQVMLLDPIRRAVGMADLNAENEVRRMLMFFERLNNEGITVVAVHHDNKEGAKAGGGNAINMTGSGAWAGDPDTIVSIEIPKGETTESAHRNLRFMLNHAPSPGTRGMKISDGDNQQISYSLDGWGEHEEKDDEPSI
jgi:hypothetical protein